MTSIKQKKAVLICVCLLSYVTKICAQINDTTLLAKVMLVQKNKVSEGKSIAAVSVSFINNSNEDIYIPAIFNISRTPQGGKIRVFVKKENSYKPDAYYGTSIPNKNVGNALVNSISGTHNELLEKYKNVSINKQKQQQTILDEYSKLTGNSPGVDNSETMKKKEQFAKAMGINVSTLLNASLKPLFLKAHEAYEIYFIKDVDYLVNVPNEYKIDYIFDYSFDNLGNYPESIMGYKRKIPKTLQSNALYIKVD